MHQKLVQRCIAPKMLLLLVFKIPSMHQKLVKISWIEVNIGTNQYELKLLKYHSKYAPKIGANVHCTRNVLI